VNWLYGRPTAAELVAAVADFLDNDVRSSVEGPVNFHARVAANVLRNRLRNDRRLAQSLSALPLAAPHRHRLPRSQA